MNYYSGVYIPDTTSGLLGGHCVKIVGWGEDAGVVRQPRAETRVHDMMAAHVALLIFFFGWLVTPALAIQVFPTGPSPTLGARSGVGVLRAVRERRV
jgi:hypothetical protein